jgi:hypothetical protein
MERYSFDTSTDQSRLDIDLVHRHLSASYWATGRSRARVELSIRHSLCFGAYHGGIRIMMLRTRDAHALYEKFGFGAIPQPDEMMVRYS